jgi:hypothetical protein
MLVGVDCRARENSLHDGPKEKLDTPLFTQAKKTAKIGV